ncbi:MAG TPA: AmmeMemoRadiSam system protein B [Anaerolineae bacterium]|nr:AmmeMemoRadiSam system protein B [Anaerolineae bacterium]
MSTTNLTIRPPAVAGTFYTDRPEKLAEAVESLLSQAQDARLGPVRAMIAPHAGYRYSGPIAASAFRQLAPASHSERPTVYLLGPAHYVYVDSVALSPAAAFATPLGQVAQNWDAIDDLLACGPAYQLDPLAHEPEHSLEVELPFLQTALSDFDLVAMLCGQTDVEQVAADLADRLRPQDLVVVSSDLSHFHPYETAQALDRAFLEAVVAGDVQRAAQGEACGLQPILLLMRLAELQGWTPHLLDYRNSGDTSGDKRRVVGYAAVAYVAMPEIPQRMRDSE